jgi:hypothetical protein
VFGVLTCVVVLAVARSPLGIGGGDLRVEVRLTQAKYVSQLRIANALGLLVCAEGGFGLEAGSLGFGCHGETRRCTPCAEAWRFLERVGSLDQPSERHIARRTPSRSLQLDQGAFQVPFVHPKFCKAQVHRREVGGHALHLDQRLAGGGGVVAGQRRPPPLEECPERARGGFHFCVGELGQTESLEPSA